MENKRTGTSYGGQRREGISKEEYRLPEARKTVKKQKRKNALKAVIIVVPILVIAVWLAFDKLFVVRNIEMHGEKEYTVEEARLAAEEIGITEGVHIFGFDKKTAEAEAKYRLTDFDSVNISFKLPDTLVLSVTEAKPAMYVVFGNSGHVLSEAMRVISVHDDTAEYEDKGLIRLEISEITNCVAGEFLTTENSSEELAKQLYLVLEEEQTAHLVTAIDVTNKYDISFEYNKQFLVKLGSADNLTVKVRYMKAILNELKPTDSGVIDVSDEECKEATFKPYDKM